MKRYWNARQFTSGLNKLNAWKCTTTEDWVKPPSLLQQVRSSEDSRTMSALVIIQIDIRPWSLLIFSMGCWKFELNLCSSLSSVCPTYSCLPNEGIRQALSVQNLYPQHHFSLLWEVRCGFTVIPAYICPVFFSTVIASTDIHRHAVK